MDKMDNEVTPIELVRTGSLQYERRGVLMSISEKNVVRVDGIPTLAQFMGFLPHVQEQLELGQGWAEEVELHYREAITPVLNYALVSGSIIDKNTGFPIFDRNDRSVAELASSLASRVAAAKPERLNKTLVNPSWNMRNMEEREVGTMEEWQTILGDRARHNSYKPVVVAPGMSSYLYLSMPDKPQEVKRRWRVSGPQEMKGEDRVIKLLARGCDTYLDQQNIARAFPSTVFINMHIAEMIGWRQEPLRVIGE